MLEKLRFKFMALNMASILLVMSLAFCAVCIMQYQRDYDNAHGALARGIAWIQDADEEAALGPGKKPLKKQAESVEKNADESEKSPYPIPVTVYRLADDGSLGIASSSDSANWVSADSVQQATSALLESADGMYALPEYSFVYLKRTTEHETYFAFADVGVLSRWKSLAGTLVIVGVGVLGVLFVINVFFSRWALRPVEETWSKQKQFIADASHELKTPLTVILANASILEKHPEKTVAEQAQWLESTQEEAQRMQELIADMLSLAQTESVAKAAHERVNISNLVAKESLQFESVAFERCVEIDDTIEENIFVRGEERALEKLTGTLIDNACKYADAHTIVSVRLTREGKKAVLAVSNFGAVIAPEDIDHVFDRFYRTDKARTHDDTRSFGLGLAIAREIAESHGGSIKAKSSAADGTTFTVTLPLAK